MKTLQESIINERISNREFKDIKGYVKGWVSECLTYTDYLDVVDAIRNGIEEAIKDNKKYYTKDYKDGKPLEDTNEFYNYYTNNLMSIVIEFYKKILYTKK